MNVDKMKLPPGKDRRRKLTPTHKRDILSLYKNNTPIREIARKYEHICCRRTIQFFLFPERDKKLKDIVKKEKRWLKYYDTKSHSAAVKNLREYKRKLFNL